MVKPISLRMRAHEATGRARQLLRKLDEKENLQRRVKWQATKALISVREMLALMPPADHDRWRAECDQTLSFLEKIKRR